MKRLSALYIAILVLVGFIVIFLTLASPHHVDKDLVISNWVIVVSFPATSYLLIRFFDNKKYYTHILFFLLINAAVFYYGFHDMVFNSDDGVREVSLATIFPILGLLLSILYAVYFWMRIFKNKSTET